MPRAARGYGWVPDRPDHRDHYFAAPHAVMGVLPASVDLRPQCPKVVYDQGQLGSCTGNAIAGAIEFDRIKQRVAVFTPSRLFIYYNERALEGTIASDSGAAIRDGVKSVSKQGAPAESFWPYVIAKFAKKPSAAAIKEGAKHTAVLYQRVNRVLNEMKGCLASGYPFVLGFTVYESFESQDVAKSGEMPMPGTEEKVLGGHAVLAVGYDDATQRFLIRNSWGDGWGMKGYFTMPYTYLLDQNLSDDFWTIRVVS